MLPAGRELRPQLGRVVIRGRRIEKIIRGEKRGPAADFGSPEHVVLPGFVDTHVHLPQFDSIGIEGMELLDWLQSVVFPAEARWADSRLASDMAARVARSLLSFGTTAVGAYASSHPAAVQAAIDALAHAGLAGHVGLVLMDQQAPKDLLLPPDQALDSVRRLRAVDRIAPAVTPRFAVSCSREMLTGAGALARETGWLIQTHLSETRDECRLVRRLHGCTSYTDVYDRAGLLTPRTILAHAIHLSDRELSILARRASCIAHCPTANRFLRSGTFDRARAARAGVRITLGSDVAGGPDRSMVRVARAMIETARAIGAVPPSPGECWHMITAGNAACLALRDTGILRPGCAADIILARPDIPWNSSPAPLATLLWAWDDRWIKRVWAAGIEVHRSP
jgi:guanine deaminase